MQSTQSVHYTLTTTCAMLQLFHRSCSLLPRRIVGLIDTDAVKVNMLGVYVHLQVLPARLLRYPDMQNTDYRRCWDTHVHRAFVSSFVTGNRSSQQCVAGAPHAVSPYCRLYAPSETSFCSESPPCYYLESRATIPLLSTSTRFPILATFGSLARRRPRRGNELPA